MNEFASNTSGPRRRDAAVAAMPEVDRRRFLQLAGSAFALGSAAWAGRVLLPESARAEDRPPDLFLGGTDGWIYLPPTPAIPPFHPDNLAPAPFTTYIFGFRNVTGLHRPGSAADQKNKAQHSAPLFWVNQRSGLPGQADQPGPGAAPRPLRRAHAALARLPQRHPVLRRRADRLGRRCRRGRDFTYVYRPHDPGTYMYHCHVEDVEHVHMGMTGLVFVRPEQDGTSIGGHTKFIYNDGDGSTGFDREFAMFLSRGVGRVALGRRPHPAAGVERLPRRLRLLNGRVYPDTIAPNGVDRPVPPGPRRERRPDRPRRPVRSCSTSRTPRW